jgi:hypothetical protein
MTHSESHLSIDNIFDIRDLEGHLSIDDEVFDFLLCPLMELFVSLSRLIFGKNHRCILNLGMSKSLYLPHIYLQSLCN